MTIWTRIFGWFRVVSKNVWAFLQPLILAVVKVEATGYIDLIRSLVLKAEAQGGTGDAKYNYVISELKRQLGDQFKATPWRVFDALISAAVLEISK